MSGEFYFFCEDCFSQWCVDGFDNIDPTQCSECGSADIGGGDLGEEGDLVNELLFLIRRLEPKEYRGTLYRYEELIRKMARKYFEYDEDFEDPEDVLERMREEY